MDNKEKIINEVGISDYRKGFYYDEELDLEFVSRFGNSKLFNFFSSI